jgi:hypothetical protein
VFQQRIDWNALLIFGQAGSFAPAVPPTPTPANSTPTGPNKAIVYSLDRGVFEPIQVFPEIIRSVTQEATAEGVTWADLTNPWATYQASWDSFPNTDQIAVFFGADGGNSTTWAELTNPWSTYNTPWDSFPAGGEVYIFSVNSPNDNGVSIPYSFTPVYLFDDSNKNILIDSWELFFKIAGSFELATIEFDALKYPKATPTTLFNTFVDLSDPTTYAIPKSLPTLNQYSRYIRIIFSGESFTRAFAFGGGTVFVMIQERPSK